MELSFTALAGNLLAPTILFFRSWIDRGLCQKRSVHPEGAAKVMSIYLLLAIGFKGGAAVGESGLIPTCLRPLGRELYCRSFCLSSPLR
jgi:hypothetical protein